MKPQEITFKADKKHRDRYFSAGSFAHPAKMMLPLQRWLIERYSRPGHVILDPMAGCGTVLIACTMGRHVIMVELESKFVQMQRDNWTKIQTLGPEMGYEMGTATILQGDARELPEVLADVVISSPPYADARSARLDTETVKLKQAWEGKGGSRFFDVRQGDNPDNISNLPYGKLADVIMTSPPYAGITGDGKEIGSKGHATGPFSYGQSPDNLGNLPYGNIDCVITSPPYEGSDVSQTHMTSDQRGDPSNPNYRPSWKTKLEQGYAETKRPYVDCVITSPPYEDKEPAHDLEFQKLRQAQGKLSQGNVLAAYEHQSMTDNIGNLKGDSYLSAMLEVYQGCWRVLKPQGLMILVTKNFIRNKQEIRLDLDTIKLCEQAGLQFVERHYRQLTSQSFWRTIYRQKYPDAPILDKEDILVFKKEELKCE